MCAPARALRLLLLAALISGCGRDVRVDVRLAPLPRAARVLRVQVLLDGRPAAGAPPGALDVSAFAGAPARIRFALPPGRAISVRATVEDGGGRVLARGEVSARPRAAWQEAPLPWTRVSPELAYTLVQALPLPEVQVEQLALLPGSGAPLLAVLGESSRGPGRKGGAVALVRVEGGRLSFAGLPLPAQPGRVGASLCAADVDGDGRTDLVATTYALPWWDDAPPAGELLLFRQREPGAFRADPPLSLSTYPSSVTPLDLDGDGRQELLVAEYTTGDLFVVRDEPGQGLRRGATYPLGGLGPVSLRVRPLRQGGPAVILGALQGAEGVSVLHQEPRGGLRPAGLVLVAANDSVAGVDVLDLDRDGLLDLAVLAQGNNRVRLLRQGPAGAFQLLPESLYAGDIPYRLLVQDVDGDGLADLTVTDEGIADTMTSYRISDVLIYRGQGEGRFLPAYSLHQRTALPANRLSPPVVHDVLYLDADGDGDLDLLVGEQRQGAVLLFRNGDGP